MYGDGKEVVSAINYERLEPAAPLREREAPGMAGWNELFPPAVNAPLTAKAIFCGIPRSNGGVFGWLVQWSDSSYRFVESEEEARRIVEGK